MPIDAELIWGLPGDNLPDFERNLDTLLASFPNINIFGYTLLTGTEFYYRREEYQIEAIPVAGYGKAKGEYVVGCHSFDRNQGEEGYFLISAHILLVHGHIMPLTTRLLALRGEVSVSPLFRDILRALLVKFNQALDGLDTTDRMAIYEGRDRIYLQVLGSRELLYQAIAVTIERHHLAQGADPRPALRVLQLDRALSPRSGDEHRLSRNFEFDAWEAYEALSAMELPTDLTVQTQPQTLEINHPGGLGEILQVADGGSWLRGIVQEPAAGTPDAEYVAIA